MQERLPVAPRSTVRTLTAAVDVVLLTPRDGAISVLLLRAPDGQARDRWILPWDSLAPVLVLKTDLSDAAAKAGDAVRDAIRSGATPGAAAAVGRAGSLRWAEAFGARDVTTGRPVDRKTMFGIGSISKTLTMAAALALVDAGRLDLDAPVERYLGDFPHPGKGVTVRRIGAHQSGIADDFAALARWLRAP